MLQAGHLVCGVIEVLGDEPAGVSALGDVRRGVVLISGDAAQGIQLRLQAVEGVVGQDGRRAAVVLEAVSVNPVARARCAALCAGLRRAGGLTTRQARHSNPLEAKSANYCSH